MITPLETEPVMEDNEFIYSGYVYIIDGKIETCNYSKITVKKFKSYTGAKEVRLCDSKAKAKLRNKDK